jgi:Protein of unknown function (DUF4239)
MTGTDNVLIVALSIAGSLFAWWLLRRIFPADRRHEHNDITGWQLSVLGTTYAVVMGFMLFAEWADFRGADQNAEVEASCLSTLYWAASGLPDMQRDEVRKLAEEYANTMITDEWPAMSHGTLSHKGTDIVRRLWATVSQSQSLNATQQLSLGQTMQEISSIAEHRRIRQLQSESRLPTVLWIILIVGAVLTLLSACLFGSQEPRLHVLQVVTLGLMLSLSLAAIADINRPFQGSVHVAPTGFENALRIFERYGAATNSH